jgi:tRNA dimethylallyltransferase
MGIKVFCLMGPTASGKTSLSIELAHDLHAEIVSVDSAMVYTDMDIGTAKPLPWIRESIPHYLIDIISPAKPYSAAQFLQDASNAIQVIHARGKIPLLVGGTMLYFKVLQQGLSLLPGANPMIREKLAQEAEQVGWHKMHARLSAVDPESARRINPNDPQRIQRALEVFEMTKKPLSELWHIKEQQNVNFEYINIGLAPDNRSCLHQKIATRFNCMIEQGFLEEVKKLYACSGLKSHLPAMRSVGYRQAWSYLDGLISYEEMIEKGIAATRQLAKRQMTWLRRWDRLTWFDTEENCYLPVREYIRRFLP